jgi:hypothetical protein
MSESILDTLGLHINKPEHAIICCSCKFALQGSVEAIVKHLAEKHNVPRSTRDETRPLLRLYTFLEPKKLPLRSDRLAPHLHLLMQHGFACRHCSFRTTSVEMLNRHLSKSHEMKRKTTTWLHDHAVNGLFLQSWDRNGACGYWIVEPNRTVIATDRFDSSLLQHCLTASSS